MLTFHTDSDARGYNPVPFRAGIRQSVSQSSLLEPRPSGAVSSDAFDITEEPQSRVALRAPARQDA
jgi:hypothetical protein